MRNRRMEFSCSCLKVATHLSLLCLCLVIGLVGLPALPFAHANDHDTRASSPFHPSETQHGFSEFDTMPASPSDATAQPLPYYQNPDTAPSLDQKPEGLFMNITLAKDVEEDLEFRRGNMYFPVDPTDEFPSSIPSIYVVFRVFKHYQAYQVIGQLFPETVDGWPSQQMLDEDMSYLALEDESGYLKFFPPSEDGWIPGQYRIDIFVGYEANAISKMGTLRFHVVASS